MGLFSYERDCFFGLGGFGLFHMGREKKGKRVEKCPLRQKYHGRVTTNGLSPVDCS